MNAFEVTLAGLVHDVGVLAARIFRPPEGLAEATSATFTQITGMPPQAAPPEVLYSLDFVLRMPYLPEAFRKDRVASLVARYRAPQEPDESLLAQAHGLFGAASGGPSPLGQRRSPSRLVAIASRIKTPAQKTPTPAWFPLTELAPAKAFPVADSALAANQASATEEYHHLWQKLCQAWAENRCPDPAGFLTRAVSVLERFTWCVPAVDSPECDVALFDHLRAVAAAAACLAYSPDGQEKPFLLLVAELAGIQKYLFDLRQGTGGLARRLRARSFKVAAYVESLAAALLRRLSLSLTQRLLFAGGKVVLLLPNTPEVQATVDDLRTTVARWIFDQSQGEVTLALTAMPISAADLADFSATYTKLSHALRSARARAGENVLTASTSWVESAFLLPAIEVAETETRCDSCRRRKALVEEEPALALCDHCRREATLGALLPRSRYLVYYVNGQGTEPAPIGSFRLAEDIAYEGDEVTYAVDLDGQGQGPDHLPLSAGFRSRYVPRDKSGRVLEFAELASRSRGRPLLAVLKMDADNLGYIFSQGIVDCAAGQSAPAAGTPGHALLARVAGLSRMLEIFFSGYLEGLLRDRYPEVYLVYSGGDDLVAIGPWDRIFDLAVDIREEFRRFTGGNPAWSLSAGVAVINPHLPVLIAIAEAEELLEFSKSAPGEGVVPLIRKEPGLNQSPGNKSTGEARKNRLTAFETSVPWEEFPNLLKQAKQLAQWIENDVLSTSQVYRLLWYAELARKFYAEGDTQYLQYVPYLARDLRRTWGGPTPDHEQAKQWASQFLLPGDREILKARFVCCYALYATRSSE
ncbi:MAG: type III-A CRISPR-associated protein Cas10/Csm1 [Thermoguttaceae bacterium]|nr:type III-A CRISPR-associated protein Cas10/Csm1 [Thermoguttaceae bacterium]MDW8080166.1 type III-A CRISPR-associated protein Cas10/Csm1 [Thermoguttaceae bacterium]